jgi:hypothetical protein
LDHAYRGDSKLPRRHQHGTLIVIMMQVVNAHIARPLFHDAPAQRASKDHDGDKRREAASPRLGIYNSAHNLHSFTCAKVVCP